MLARLIRHFLARRRPPGAVNTIPGSAGSAVESYGSASREWLRRGEALEAQGDLTGAIECYRACAAAHPRDLKVRLALTNALASGWHIEECLVACAEALELAPNDYQVFSGLLLYSHYAEHPDARALFELHRRYGRVLAAAIPPAPANRHGNARDPERALRIGYVSRNFSLHSVGYFIEPVLARHDREKHRVHCYYTHPQVDATTQRVAQLVDVWRHVHAEDSDALAAQIRDDEIDILVDLGGHTKLNHLPAFARKPAPVQMTWLGYPNTTGLSSIDYRITDATADPPASADALCSERLIRLEAPFLCYRPPADSPPVASRPREGNVVFGSFNVLLKVNGALIDLWARILEGVPGSRMLIKASLLAHDETMRRLLERFRAAGIGADRLELRRWETQRTSHLETYNEIDIALDTFPYNGTTTTCEALWMGVPVVTLAGELHMSRVGASLLQAVGLEALVASRPDEYVRRAVDLAHNVEARRVMRGSMRDRLTASALLDHQAFTRKLEDAFRTTWRTWCASAANGTGTPAT